MKAIVVSPNGLQWTNFDDPQLKEGELRVEVLAVALTNLLKGQASGTHYSKHDTPVFVPGMDGVGRLADGRRVYFMATRRPFGSLAERSITREGFYVPVPDEISDVRAAALGNPAMSSWAALTKRAQLARGESVLINGATGVAGKMAIQIAKHLGAKRVIATGRDAKVLQTLAALGADTVLALDSSFEAHVKDVIAEVDIVLDYLWGTSAETLIGAIGKTQSARPVRYVQVGSIAGTTISMPASPLRASALQLMGSGLGSVTDHDLIASIRGALKVASQLQLQVESREVAVAEAPSVWNASGSERVVFKVSR